MERDAMTPLHIAFAIEATQQAEALFEEAKSRVEEVTTQLEFGDAEDYPEYQGPITLALTHTPS